MKKVALLDDYQGAGISQPYWRRLSARIVLEGFRDTLHDESELVERLRPFQIVVPIRERTHFSAPILRQLPTLELLSLTGKNSGQVDMAAATEQRILVTQTEGSGPSAIEMTMALMLALAHRVPQEDRAMHLGLWQTGIGFDLSGKVLGIVGLGRIGTRIAAFGNQWGCACWLGARILRNKKQPRREQPTWSSTICSGRATSSRCTCGFPSGRTKSLRLGIFP